MDRLKIYLDTCCFARPFDDLSQTKVRFEREAVLSVISSCEASVLDVYRSDVLDDEIDRIVNPVKRQKIIKLYSSATIYIEISDAIISRAAEFIGTFNIGSFDALHLASAEFGGADVLLTTDKKFINRALQSNTSIRVANPAIWLTEVLLNDQ